MAVVKGIEISGDIYDIEDETARTNASEASENASEAKTSVATLSEEVLSMKESLDEIVVQNYQVSQKVGNTATPLDTTAQTLVGAVNELAQKSPQCYSGFIRNANGKPKTYSFAEDDSNSIPFSEIKAVADSIGYTIKAGDFITLRGYNASEMYFYKVGIGRFSTVSTMEELAPYSGRSEGFFFYSNEISLEKRGSSYVDIFVEVEFSHGA